MKPFTTLIIVLLMAAFMFTGCSKVNRENYEKIKMGMAYSQVIELIGDPDKCDAALGMKSCVWGNKTKNITINFIAEKVVLPSMNGL